MKKNLLLYIVLVFGISALSAQQVGRGAIMLRKASVTHVPVVTKATQPIQAIDAGLVTKSKLFANHQVQLEISKGNASLENLIANDGSVRRNFVVHDQQRINRNYAAKQFVQQQASKDTTFFESWELYDDSTENWMPAYWTQLNKSESKYVAGSPNMRWFCRDVGTSATDGNAIAWVNFDDTGKMRDEWMVSPTITPVQSDFLAFDLYYAPFYMYFDMDAYNLDGTVRFNFARATTTMQVLISEDNGANWTKVWDAHNYANQYNDTTIFDYQGDWRSFHLSLENYVGKKVQLAFRYSGKGGDSMGLDNIGVRLLKPNANYGRPQGYFMLGITPDYANATVDLMLGVPYQKSRWKNNSNHDSQSFVWTFEDQQKPTATFSTTEIEPSVVYPAGFYGIPELKASVGGFTSSYKWGSSTNGAYFMTGGTNTFDWGTLGAGNYDLAYGIAAYTFADNEYVFGTGPQKKIDGVANYFEKPASTYLLDKLWISLGAFSAPKGTQFKLKIRKVDEKGDFNTVLATATCTAEDVIKVANGYYTMPFKNFVSYDPDLDLLVTNDFLEIKDALLIEMYGFNKTGIKLGVYSQGLMRNGESNAYIYYNNYQSGKRQLYNIRDFIGYSTSLLFNLGATYSYLVPSDTVFTAPAAGGSKTFKVTTYAPPSDWWINEEMPAWISSSSTFDDATGATTYTLTAQALPAGISERAYKLTVYAIGTSMTINVMQNNTPSSASDNSKSPTGLMEIIEGSDFQSVDIYNIAGQKLESYDFSTAKDFTLAMRKNGKGVYILKFKGKRNQTIKIIQK